MKFLITGHTGFKGAWLSLLLDELGHVVSGVALDPLPNALFSTGHFSGIYEEDFRRDIRSAEGLKEVVTCARPDVLIHLAAQPLVRDSYREPRSTFEVNVMGTLNVLEAASECPDLQALLIVTTDKVYRNNELHTAFQEDDPLGGVDPYSASKAMADILAQSWAKSFPGVPTAIARAGNVVGGGDVSPERLVPDTLRALGRGSLPTIRFPHAVRPWQHVLDCLYGYVQLVDLLVQSPNLLGVSTWNFGPEPDSFAEVGDVVRKLATIWGFPAHQIPTEDSPIPEAGFLTLDSTKAATELGWRNVLDLDSTLDWVAHWQRLVDDGKDPLAVTREQVRLYLEMSESN